MVPAMTQRIRAIPGLPASLKIEVGVEKILSLSVFDKEI